MKVWAVAIPDEFDGNNTLLNAFIVANKRVAVDTAKEILIKNGFKPSKVEVYDDYAKIWGITKNDGYETTVFCEEYEVNENADFIRK